MGGEDGCEGIAESRGKELASLMNGITESAKKITLPLTSTLAQYVARKRGQRAGHNYELYRRVNHNINDDDDINDNDTINANDNISDNHNIKNNKTTATTTLTIRITLNDKQ